jgi:hypothetical protein
MANFGKKENPQNKVTAAKNGLKIGRPKEWDDEKIANEAEDFMTWSEMDGSMNLKSFAAERRYAPSYLVYLSDRSEKFADAMKIARQNIANRREQKAGNGFDSGVAKMTMALYDDEYKQHQMELKHAGASKIEPTVVKIVSYKDEE